ncbi:MAG: helix-turn-helix transcriptional regulator [Oscillospiraceae bacterium]|nr:helix-turn-helix transcriptional regulator [Oscillospiraceae bacterium]
MVYSGVDKRIKNLRTKRGMTQVELASLLGVSKSVVSSYENAVHLPPYDILIKLANIFGVSSDYLQGNVAQRNISTDGLTENQIQAVESIVSELKRLNCEIPTAP